MIYFDVQLNTTNNLHLAKISLEDKTKNIGNLSNYLHYLELLDKFLCISA